MGATAVIVLLWLAFAATHMVLSDVRVRTLIVDRIGTSAFLALYSVIALALFVPLVQVYLANKHSGPLLWSIGLGAVARWVFYVFVGAALTLAVNGILQPSPGSLLGGKAEVRGVLRLTRHPLFMGFGLLGLLHMIPNGFASDLAFFAGLPVFAVVGCRHQDQRKIATGTPGYRELVAATPFLPFTKPGAWQGLGEIGIAKIAVGIIVTVVIRWFHAALF